MRATMSVCLIKKDFAPFRRGDAVTPTSAVDSPDDSIECVDLTDGRHGSVPRVHCQVLQASDLKLADALYAFSPPKQPTKKVSQRNFLSFSKG